MAFEQNIGTDAQLTSHIAALKALFGFLIDKKQKFSDLNGYISTPSFKGKYLDRVDRSNNILKKMQKCKLYFCSI